MQPSPNLAPVPSVPAPPAPVPTRQSRWLSRLDLFVRIILHLYLGMILVFWPWTPFWTYNRFLLYFAPVARVAAAGALRGLVSGLGFLNLWIAIFDAIHYKEN